MGGVLDTLLRTVACRKKFTEHPDIPALTLHRYRIVCFSATVRRNILSLSVNLTLTPSKIKLILEPDPLHREEEGSGHPSYIRVIPRSEC